MEQLETIAAVDHQPLLQTTDLSIGYKQGRNNVKEVAEGLNLEMFAGSVICLLGPNGCGKSTLLRTVAGLQETVFGMVQIEGTDLGQLKPAQLAKKISMVLTDNVRSGDLDVYSLIALGRYPHSGWLGRLTAEDKAVIDQAILSTDTGGFVERKLATLSDGECQKVMLARAIAQDTPIIILDEPTAHLDLPSRIQLMRLLHRLAKDTQKAILISTHELDLALQVADQIWLMQSDGHMATGLPEELVLNGSFAKAFNKDGILFDSATGSFNMHSSGVKSIAVNGDGTAAFWTRKALLRKGFNITNAQKEPLVVTVLENEGQPTWTLETGMEITVYTTLGDFLNNVNLI